MKQTHDVLLGQRWQFLKDTSDGPRAAVELGGQRGSVAKVIGQFVVDNDFGNEIGRRPLGKVTKILKHLLSSLDFILMHFHLWVGLVLVY